MCEEIQNQIQDEEYAEWLNTFKDFTLDTEQE